MIQAALLANLFLVAWCSEENIKIVKPYTVFPVPLEFPNRNDRADQCWLRIEDVELTETLTVFCYKAHELLNVHIPDYNSRKMEEDDVNVSLWSGEPKKSDEQPHQIVSSSENDKTVTDWRVATVLDPLTHMRLYVTKNADCKLIMYSREGMSNYKVDCGLALYFFNSPTSNVSTVSIACNTYLFLLIVFLSLFSF